MLPEDTRKAIEPDVRAVLRALFDLKKGIASGADAEALGALAYRVEYGLGQMLPTVHGRLNVDFAPALAGMTLHGRFG